jgi:di/tricarboxylate transporter
VPIAFFLLALLLAAIGAGNSAATALIAPAAMATAHRAGIPPFLMMVVDFHGENAGALTPIAPTGVIAAGRARDRLGLDGVEAHFFQDNHADNVVIGLGGYLVFGGWRLFASSSAGPSPMVVDPSEAIAFDLRHRLTLGLLCGLLVAVVGFDANVGMTALAAGSVLVLAGLADEADAIRRMPWGVILMVGGVTVLTSLLEATGGSALFTDLVADISGPRSVTGVIALIAGVVSVYASSSGVVLPAFLPIAAGLAAQTGGDVAAIASSIVVGGHLVDASPLSTLGALAVASAHPSADRRRLFNQGLAWGLSMAVVGAAFCLVWFGLR